MGNGVSRQNLDIRELPVSEDVSVPVTSFKDWQKRILKYGLFIFFGTMAVERALFISRNERLINDLQSSLTQKIGKGVKYKIVLNKVLNFYNTLR